MSIAGRARGVTAALLCAGLLAAAFLAGCDNGTNPDKGEKQSLSGGKPAALSDNASYNAALAKLDGIIAYCGDSSANAQVKTQAQSLRQQLSAYATTYRENWDNYGPTVVSQINSLINALSDSEDTGGGGGKPAALSGTASYNAALAKLDEIIAYCGNSSANAQVKAAAQNSRQSLFANATAYQQNWDNYGPTWVSQINSLINALSDSEDTGSGENETPPVGPLTWPDTLTEAGLYSGTANGTNVANPQKVANAGTGYAALIAYIQNNAANGGAYLIVLGADENVGSMASNALTKAVNLTLRGDSAMRTLTLTSDGSLLYVANGVTLTLGNNITLKGKNNNTKSLVYVYGGDLIMQAGSAITGNANTDTAQGNSGGGVYVTGSGTFTMNGGTVSDNKTACGSQYLVGGGGVYVFSGTFTMTNGTIKDNEVNTSGSPNCGGGVCSYGNFTMSGGTISGNKGSRGGGVYVRYATFTMSGGTISGNEAVTGGGVYLEDGQSTFIKTGGTIYGSNAENTSDKNTADQQGHAAYVSNSKYRDTTADSSVNLSSSNSTNWGQ